VSVKEPVIQQLPLGVTLRDDLTLDTFYPGSNQEALHQIKNIARGIGEPFVYLWGRVGAGCTHLLQGACVEAAKFQRTAFYLSLDPDIEMSRLEGLEQIDLVCLDHLDKVVAHARWEEAVFHLYNRIRQNNHRLIIAASQPPQAIGVQLPDLRSRLSWGVVYPIHLLDDEELLAALKLRAVQRGLDLSDEIGHFLIRRCTRSMPQLYQMLETLDKAQLVAQRRLTIPFVKTVLKL